MVIAWIYCPVVSQVDCTEILAHISSYTLTLVLHYVGIEIIRFLYLHQLKGKSAKLQGVLIWNAHAILSPRTELPIPCC